MAIFKIIKVLENDSGKSGGCLNMSLISCNSGESLNMCSFRNLNDFENGYRPKGQMASCNSDEWFPTLNDFENGHSIYRPKLQKSSCNRANA